MKVSAILSVVASATFAAAQLSDLPSCALTCAISSLGSTGCSETDIKCVCSATSFLTGITSCVQGACSAADFQKTLTAAAGLCASVGVTLNLPGGSTTTAAATTSAAPASTAVASASSSSAAVYVSSSAAVYVSSSAAPVSTTLCSETSTKVAVVTTTVCESTTAATYVPVTTIAASNATSTYVPPPAYTGAAAHVAGSIVLAGAGAFAALLL